jgi:3-deoxy-D-manno-octulosonic acid (KDO) 8-phosphate synthase
MISEIIRDSYKDQLNELNLLEMLTSKTTKHIIFSSHPRQILIFFLIAGPEVKENPKLTLQVAKILENLEKLDKMGLVSKSNSYKKIMEDIHKDVTSKTEIRGKLEKELATLKAVIFF